MNYKKKILISLSALLIISLLSYLYTLYIINCNHLNDYSCSTLFFDELIPMFVLTPLFISAPLLFVIFFSERVFNVWKKFAIFAIPLMLIGILLIKVTPNECDMMFCVDRTFMIYFSGILYLILSILVTSISAIYFKIKNR